MAEPIITEIDGLPCRLAAPWDFSFLRQYGRVFQVFDDQDSGNLCFGTEKEGMRFFVKFAGAPTARGTGSPAQAIERLRAAVPIYRNLAHPNLIQLLEAHEAGKGYAAVFRWAEGDCMGRMYPEPHARFMALPLETRMAVYRDVLDFLAYVNRQGYVAVDFYDGSILYDFKRQTTTICDIDFFRKQPATNDMGRLWGSSLFMSPEEYQLGAVLDQVTNVYTAGAVAFALFGGYRRERENWQLDSRRFAAVSRAVDEDRSRRHSSIEELSAEWNLGILEG